MQIMLYVEMMFVDQKDALFKKKDTLFEQELCKKCFM
jgi:hypothetical protein